MENSVSINTKASDVNVTAVMCVDTIVADHQRAEGVQRGGRGGRRGAVLDTDRGGFRRGGQGN